MRVTWVWSRLRDPAALQSALNAAHAQTKLYVIGNAPGTADEVCAGDYVQPSTGVPQGTVAVDSTDQGEFNGTMHRDLLPTDTTLVLVVNYLSPHDGQASTLWYFATGRLPECVPTRWKGSDGGGTL